MNKEKKVEDEDVIKSRTDLSEAFSAVYGGCANIVLPVGIAA
jgi:hypothetical protein